MAKSRKYSFCFQNVSFNKGNTTKRKLSVKKKDINVTWVECCMTAQLSVKATHR